MASEIAAAYTSVRMHPLHVRISSDIYLAKALFLISLCVAFKESLKSHLYLFCAPFLFSLDISSPWGFGVLGIKEMIHLALDETTIPIIWQVGPLIIRRIV